MISLDFLFDLYLPKDLMDSCKLEVDVFLQSLQRPPTGLSVLQSIKEGHFFIQLNILSNIFQIKSTQDSGVSWNKRI